MANTKNLTRDTRRAQKRAQRRSLKDLCAGMTREERKAFRKEEDVSLKVFLTKHRAAAAKARAEALAKKEAAAGAAAGAGETPAEA